MELKFSHFLAFRCFCAFFIRTFYNPDEYYQSMEMAHKMAFGYGVVTWEWTIGIRSFFYPAFISIPYRILKYLGLDNPYPYLLVIIPRIMHAVFTSIGETMFYKMVKSRLGENVANWTAFFMLINWFIFTLSPRTLTNTVEMALLLIVLSLFPYRIQKDKMYWSYLTVCTIAFYIRCTSAISFVPIGLYHIFKDFSNFRRTLKIALPISLVLSVGFIALDWYYSRDLYFAPLRFFIINVWDQASSIFGTSAFHFYLTSTLPHVLLTLMPLFVCYLVVILSPYGEQEGKLELRLLSSVLLFNLLITSLNPHKEDRFILPVIPLALLIAGVAASRIDAFLKQKTKPFVHKYLLTWFLTTTILANGTLIIDKSLFVDHGRHAIVDEFRNSFHEDLKGLEMRPSVLFLGECFGYPLTCILHRNYVETRYVSCRDQDYFLKNPASWFYKYMKQTGPDSDYITHLIVTGNQMIWNMYRVLYATGFVGDVTMVGNSIPDYKYRQGGASIVLRRDFSKKREWWYFNETSSKWVFNLTIPPDMEDMEKKTVITELKEDNSTISAGTHNEGDVNQTVKADTNNDSKNSSVSEGSELPGTVNASSEGERTESSNPNENVVVAKDMTGEQTVVS